MKIYAVGGYNEVGKNMTVLDMGDDAVIFDSGIYLPPIVELEEQERQYNEKFMREIGALPDDLILDKMDLRRKVRALLLSHCHLDHIGALPYIEHRYNADIVGTPYTIELAKELSKDINIRMKNNLKAITPNSSYLIKGKHNYEAEFLNVTHSTLQATLIALHTPQGVVLYANDFKFDNSPILGKKPDYARLKELAKEGVKALVLESVYAEQEGKTPSEKIAKYLLEDVLFTTANEDACIVITTFSSHIARLKSIVEFGKQLGRKIVFAGRSLQKYVSVASRLNLINFDKEIFVASYKNQMKKALKEANNKRNEYMLVVTGHQGEPGSILDRISREKLPFSLKKDDHIIFSSRTIPSPVNIANKTQLEKRLKSRGVRIFSDVHVSGHAFREDLRDLIKILNPEHVIAAHGDMHKLTALAELCTELDYKLGKSVHIMQNSQSLQV